MNFRLIILALYLAVASWFPTLFAQTVTVQMIPASGMEFTCRVAGDPTGEPVILLHGWPETSHMWIPVMEQLAKDGYFCVAPNQRGFSEGARPKKVKHYHIDSLMQDVFALAAAVGADKFHLIGHDWGSAVGWAMVSQSPERIKSWTAMSVPHIKAFSDAIRFDEEQRKKSKYMKQLQLKGIAEWYLLRKDRKVLRQAWSECTEEQLADYLEVIGHKKALKATLAWYRANYKTLKKGKGIEVYDDITTPTLFIWGNTDLAVTRTAAEGTAAFMKGPYQFVELDAGHWLVQEAFEECMPAIIAHLNKYP